MGAFGWAGHHSYGRDPAQGSDRLVLQKRLEDVPVLLRNSLEYLEIGRHTGETVLLAQPRFRLEQFSPRRNLAEDECLYQLLVVIHQLLREANSDIYLSQRPQVSDT